MPNSRRCDRWEGFSRPPSGIISRRRSFALGNQTIGLPAEQIAVSPLANVITPEEKAWEQRGRLPTRIGSTGSGTGAAVMARAARGSETFPLSAVKAENVAELQPYLQGDTTIILREFLNAGKRVVVEGTQGFGLSLLHGGHWPKATSRDTTAAGFISESGLSPLDVDDVTLVIRCHPIRVAGDSDPFLTRFPGRLSPKKRASKAAWKSTQPSRTDCAGLAGSTRRLCAKPLQSTGRLAWCLITSTMLIPRCEAVT